MEELAKLGKSTLKRKLRRMSVPRAVNYWLFFKRHILEKPEVRAQFEAKPLNVDAFRLLVWTEANPLKWGPSFCRRRRSGKSDKTAKRNTNDMLAVLWHYYKAILHPDSAVRVAESKAAGGLGVFARRRTTAAAGGTPFKNHLWGVPFEVDDKTFAELQSDNFPSLYHTLDGRGTILCGPLSLVNHQCGAPLAFSPPRKVIVRPTASPSSSSSSAGIAVEEFAGLNAVYVVATGRYRTSKDDEVTVDYFAGASRIDSGVSFAGVSCRCSSCAATITTTAAAAAAADSNSDV